MENTTETQQKKVPMPNIRIRFCGFMFMGYAERVPNAFQRLMARLLLGLVVETFDFTKFKQTESK